ncbi:MAG: hypothetical protein IT365_21580 [Candidatus Hydrogenedentes bacterium]|nr:hypothetical protein [Candidatus Hydrogenedentota bacterium]
MRFFRSLPVVLLPLVTTMLAVFPVRAQGTAGEVRVYDTVTGSFAPLTAVAMSSPSRWKAVDTAAGPHAFAGDAVIMTDKIATVFRKNSAGAEAYARTATGWVRYASLIPKGEQIAKSVDTLTALKSGKDEAVLEAVYKTGGTEALSVRFQMRSASGSLEVLPLKNASHLLLEASARYAVLPSTTGAGLLVDPMSIKTPETRVSGERWILHMIEQGDAIVLCEWGGEETGVTAKVGGPEDARVILSSEIPLPKEGVRASGLLLKGAWREKQVAGAAGVQQTHVLWRWPEPAPWAEASADAQAPGAAARTKLAEFEAQADAVAGGGTVPFAVLLDSGAVSDAPLSSEAMAGFRKWTKVEADDTAHTFAGDAVVMNDKIAVAVRKNGTGAELYSREGNTFRPQATVSPSTNGAVQKLASLKIESNADDAVILNAAYATADGGTAGIRYEVNMGQVFLKTQPMDGTAKAVVKAPSRYAVLPDFFADDIIIDARGLPSDHAELPSENFLLHMTDGGNAIVITVWDNREQEVGVAVSGTGNQRQIAATEVAYGEKGAVWVAILAGQGVWHEREIGLDEKDRILPLNWRTPYPAIWRVDFTRSDRLTDSWEMLSETGPGKFKKHGLFTESEDSWTIQDWWGSGARTRIASGLGRFQYPCWVDLNGQGFLQPLKEGIEFKGPAVLYPINRLAATPLEKHTLVDVVRATLGVGPCQYILDLEGQQEQAAGWPTCTVQDVLDEIYEKNQQAAQREEVKQALKNVVDFITMIRHRIDAYEKFGKDMQAYLSDAQTKDAAHAAFFGEMLEIVKEIDAHIAASKDKIKSIEVAQKLADDFRAQVLNDDSSGAVEKCKSFTSQWVEIGGAQDELVAECRKVVKVLRQRAGMALAQDESLGTAVGHIREQTQNMLRAPVNYEAARH